MGEVRGNWRWLVLASTVAWSAFGAVPVEDLCSRSDVVATGVVRFTPGGSGKSLELAPDRTWKGSLNAGAAVKVAWPGDPGVVVIPNDYFAIWFLKRTTSGTLEIIPFAGSKAPLFASGLAVPKGGGAGIPPGDCTGGVVSELARAARSLGQSAHFLRSAEVLANSTFSPGDAANNGAAATIRQELWRSGSAEARFCGNRGGNSTKRRESFGTSGE